ncbi:MAG TPA: hypothetical protein EYQ50_07360 [Verrucomicrobiales bacterium]|nr:hypothetical protein [Verrucomicrobiales bacterium]
MESQFGRNADYTVPVNMDVTYVLAPSGIWMYGELTSEVPVRIEQLEYITFFHFEGDPQRINGKAYIAPGWSDHFTDLEPQLKKCERNSSSKYFYSAPWLDRRAMGWSWLGKGIWTVFPNACATRSRFQKDIGVFYHFDSLDRGPEFNSHYITFQAEAQHHYRGCDWYTLPRNPFGEAESADVTVRLDQWTLHPGEKKYYGPYLIALTDHPSDQTDADGLGYRQACRLGEELRQEWPPPWFPVRPKEVKFRLVAPLIDDGLHYSLVLWNRHYWFSTQATSDALLSLRIFPGAYEGALIRTDDKLSHFKLLKRLFEGKTVDYQDDRVYEVVVK